MKPNLSLKKLLVLTASVGILSVSFHGIGLFTNLPQIFYSDVLGFFQKATTPGFPYLEKNIEYPVITGIFIQLMGYAGINRGWYFIFSSFFLLLFAVATTYFLYKLVPPENQKRVLLYWIFAPSFLIFLTYNWDILAVFFSVAALYLAGKEKNGASAVALALGASSKLYPALYLAPLLLKIKSGRYRLKTFFVFLFAAAAINIYFAWKNFSGWFYFFWLNQTRNSNPDSLWTTIRFLSGDLNISTINIISLLLFLCGASFVIWKMRGRSRMEIGFGLTLVFLLTNKVFTPQYLLWLLPFFVLAPVAGKTLFYALEFSNAAVLFTILPWFFSGHNIFYFYLGMPFVIIRHLLLFVILIILLRQKLPQNTAPHAES